MMYELVLAGLYVIGALPSLLMVVCITDDFPERYRRLANVLLLAVWPLIAVVCTAAMVWDWFVEEVLEEAWGEFVRMIDEFAKPGTSTRTGDQSGLGECRQ